nr:MAG TPA: hypothetical protein [Caudoviricetes sp.]
MSITSLLTAENTLCSNTFLDISDATTPPL